MIGDIAPVPEADKEGVRSAYLARNPGSFWVNFGDFTLFRMTRMVTGRLIGGFARAGQVGSATFFVVLRLFLETECLVLKR